MILTPPWLAWALNEARTGVVEVPGVNHNPRILFYHSFTTLKATTDEVAWCSSFVCASLAETGFKHTHSARARSYLFYGQELAQPYYGSIVVLRRGTAHDKTVLEAPGHVGFLIAAPTPTEIMVLSGNQSNQVCVRPYLAADVLSYRSPA